MCVLFWLESLVCIYFICSSNFSVSFLQFQVKLSHQQHTTDPESASFIPYFDSEKVWANELSKNVTEAGASSTSQPTQEADWVKDFAEQKAKQGEKTLLAVEKIINYV